MQPCKKSLHCVTQYFNGNSDFPDCQGFPLDHSCFCFDWDQPHCNIVQPCKRGNVCVREASGIQFCVRSEGVAHFHYQLHRVKTLPTYFSTILFAIEILFICIKSATVNHSKKGFRIVGGACFIIESIAGLALTILQLIIVILMNYATNISWAAQFGAALFVISEVISIISEGINVRRKIYFETKKVSLFSKETSYTSNSQSPKWWTKLPLMRRVVAKYISVILASVCLLTKLPPLQSVLSSIGIYSSSIFEFENNVNWIFILPFSYIVIHTIISFSFKHRLWSRIISASFFLTVLSTYIFYSIISALTNREESQDFESLGPFQFGGPTVLAIFLFSLSIFNTAISGINLMGYRESRKLTQEQVEFVETAIIGPVAIVAVIVSLSFLFGDRLSIVTVGFPQIAVLLFPVLLEYASPLWSMMTGFYIKSVSWLV